LQSLLDCFGRALDQQKIGAWDITSPIGSWLGTSNKVAAPVLGQH
jgi:hypothetical protein